MANYDYTVGGAATAVPAEGLNLLHRRAAVVDFDSSNDNGANRTAADVLRLIDVAEGDFVLLVAAELITAEGGTFTFDVGDGGAVNRFLDGVDGNGTAGTRYLSWNEYTQDGSNADLELPTTLTAGVNSILGGMYYTAADTIDMVVNNNVDAAKIRLSVFLFNIDSPQTVANAGTLAS